MEKIACCFKNELYLSDELDEAMIDLVIYLSILNMNKDNLPSLFDK
jgi:hypothetical protein